MEPPETVTLRTPWIVPSAVFSGGGAATRAFSPGGNPRWLVRQRPVDRVFGGRWHHMAGYQSVEQHADAGQMLLNGESRLRVRVAHVDGEEFEGAPREPARTSACATLSAFG
jgi:hypothetical protein